MKPADNETPLLTGFKRRVHDEESAAFWRFVDEDAAEVAKWPDWKRGTWPKPVRRSP